MLSEFLYALATDPTVTTTTNAAGDAGLWVPGGMFLTAAGLLFKAATTYKEARQIDVDGAKKREAEAEAELVEVKKSRDEVKVERDNQIGDLRNQISGLHDQVTRLEGEIGQMRADYHRTSRETAQLHATELAAAQERAEEQIRVAYRIREWCAGQGLSIPPDVLGSEG